MGHVYAPHLTLSSVLLRVVVVDGYAVGMKEYVGVSEIAKMLGTTRQYASQIAARRDFPEPLVTLAMGSVWRTEDVREWAKSKGRELHA